MAAETERARSAGVPMLTSAEVRTVRCLVERVIPGAEVRVFGSRATGRARPFSDLDLLFVQPPRLTWMQRADLRDAFDASDLPFRVDLVDAEGLVGGIACRVGDESVPLGNL